jgi:hypothetical protein
MRNSLNWKNRVNGKVHSVNGRFVIVKIYKTAPDSTLHSRVRLIDNGATKGQILEDSFNTYQEAKNRAYKRVMREESEMVK